MRKALITLALLVSSQFSFGQDSVKIFLQEDLFWYLTNYHPISKQAALQINRGENEVKKAKGLLDPFLFSTYNQKQYKEQEYYDLFYGGLKIPTWYGVDFNAGYEQNQGLFINPESQSPENGLLSAGFSVSIGQGLFIDQRRVAIKQAKLYAQSTFVEQELILNNLFYDASISYLQWVNYYSQMILFQNAVDLANERFVGVKQSFVGGDVPAIDTLEAYIQVQVRDANLNQAKLNYQNATLDLSNYLWFENNTPLEITSLIAPPTIDSLSVQNSISIDSLNSILENLKTEHPQLQWYNYKLSQLDVERKWNSEQLKPTLNLKYNLLNEPIGQDVLSGFSTNNYTWGFDFGIPLFLRQSRGRLGLTKLKIQETQFDVNIKWLELTNKIRAYHNELTALEQQIQLFNAATLNYFNLLKAEQRKFAMGESSIFLINSRETAYVQAAIKLIEIKTKYQSAFAEFKLASATWF
ncbi:MAG: TolC family protein [Cyclobacteriaceae bacterium]|nr:TolC family protein [Cyclobacteriaceae bacterium]